MEDCLLAEFLPSVEELFKLYDVRHFDGMLGAVGLEWSNRMTQCAGICMFRRRPGDAPTGRVLIRLSRPLLQLRPFSDTIDTLLHEMIHAYLLLMQGGSLDRDGHGADFCAVMERINAKEGTHITIYHSFHDEVNHYRRHVWRCNGPCRERPPFFGWVRRAMNRPPQQADSWWAAHRASCTGSFIKTAGPGVTKDDTRPRVFVGKAQSWGQATSTRKERDTPAGREKAAVSTGQRGKPQIKIVAEEDKPPSRTAISTKVASWGKMTDYFPTIEPADGTDRHAEEKSGKDTVFACPNCAKFTADTLDHLNRHLDTCLTGRHVIELD